MNHYRTVFLIVVANVFKFKTFGQIVVYLNCTQLPFTTKSVFYHKVEFRTVECSLASFHCCGQTFFFGSLYNALLCHLPMFLATNVFLFVVGVTKRNLCSVIFKVQYLKDIENNIYNFAKFFFNLVGTAEKVSIVLCKRAYTCKSVQLTTLLVTVNCTKFCNTKW